MLNLLRLLLRWVYIVSGQKPNLTSLHPSSEVCIGLSLIMGTNEKWVAYLGWIWGTKPKGLGKKFCERKGNVRDYSKVSHGQMNGDVILWWGGLCIGSSFRWNNEKFSSRLTESSLRHFFLLGVLSRWLNSVVENSEEKAVWSWQKGSSS